MKPGSAEARPGEFGTQSQACPAEHEAAPLVLAMVLGPMMENALRQSLIMANGSAAIFFTRPISLAVALLVLILLVLPMLPWVKKKREVIAEIVE